MRILDEIEIWKVKRNTLIHALMNNAVESSDELKKSCADEAYIITRKIDDYLVKPYKKKNNIRKKYNIQ